MVLVGDGSRTTVDEGNPDSRTPGESCEVFCELCWEIKTSLRLKAFSSSEEAAPPQPRISVEKLPSCDGGVCNNGPGGVEETQVAHHRTWRTVVGADRH